jgi:hypothetical protein
VVNAASAPRTSSAFEPSRSSNTLTNSSIVTGRPAASNAASTTFFTY